MNINKSCVSCKYFSIRDIGNNRYFECKNKLVEYYNGQPMGCDYWVRAVSPYTHKDCRYIAQDAITCKNDNSKCRLLSRPCGLFNPRIAKKDEV